MGSPDFHPLEVQTRAITESDWSKNQPARIHRLVAQCQPIGLTSPSVDKLAHFSVRMLCDRGFEFDLTENAEEV